MYFLSSVHSVTIKEADFVLVDIILLTIFMKKVFVIIIHFDWVAGFQILYLDKEKHKSYKNL